MWRASFGEGNEARVTVREIGERTRALRNLGENGRELLAVESVADSGALSHAQSRMSKDTFEQIKEGRTDLVFEYVGAGHPAISADKDGISLLQWCSYYGDVSAMKFLVARGASLASLGGYYDLHTAAFHGHPHLCEYLIEQGANVNKARSDTGESPLHAALCTTSRKRHDAVLKVLLAGGANPNCFTKPSVATDHFMRDCRTKGETPLHRAAAFGTEATIEMLLEAGARVDAKDMNGDSPLSWASWYLRPRQILQKLCYDRFKA